MDAFAVVLEVEDGIGTVFPLVFLTIVVVGPEAPVALFVDVLAPFVAQACISVIVNNVIFFVRVWQ